MATAKNVANWFEIPVTDIRRAVKFYSAVLGVTPEIMDMGERKMAMFRGNKDEFGMGGALVQDQHWEPNLKGTTVYFSSDDVNGPLGKVEKAGGKVLVSKSSIGEYGFVAYFKDTEGNRVALHSMK